MTINDVRVLLVAHAGEMRADLRRLVELESPSDDPDGLRRCAEVIAERARAPTGGRVHVIEHAQGPHVDIVVAGADRRPVLILGHFDTVWPVGTLAARPCTEVGSTARGPGVFDMKAGIVQGLWAMHALGRIQPGQHAVRMLLNSDEETQSRRSRPIIEAAAREARAALVLEPSLDGALKTARKGVARFDIAVRGRAAHAGVEPEAGRSAIAEMARVVTFLHGLTDARTGTTLNVGLISGGTRPNVVAAEAHAVVDVRVKTPAEAGRVTTLVRGLQPTQEGIEIAVSGGFARPPMERTPQIGALFVLAQRVAAEMGLELSEAATGGASDGNFCAAVGIPVLDGLGAVGGGAHAVEEHVVTDAMPLRAALGAGVIAAIPTDGDHPLPRR